MPCIVRLQRNHLSLFLFETQGITPEHLLQTLNRKSRKILYYLRIIIFLYRKEKDGTIIEDPEIDVIISLVGGAKKGVPKLVETYMKYKYGQPTIPIDLDVSVNSESDEIEAMVSTFTKLLKNHD